MLQIIDLKVNYGDALVLRGIDLDIANEEIVAVVGESGAGKTTLGLSIIGLCEGETSGEILLDNINLLSLSEEEKRKIRGQKISIVFQDVAGSLNPVMTVFEQVLEAILISGKEKSEAEKHASNLLYKVGLGEEINGKYPHQLSGGQKQRILIAIALANNPKIIVLDEPTSSVDALTRVEILSLLKKISKGCSLVLVTHDISTVAKLAKKTAVLYQGKIIEMGNTCEIVKNPRHPYTRGLIRSYPNMTTTKDLQGIPGTKSEPVKGCPFHPRCTQKIPQCLISEPKLVESGSRKIACHRGGVMSVLKVEKLFKKFDRLQALDDVSLNLNEGDSLAVIGESGSGKTTLARCIMGLERPERGRIFLEGQKVDKRDKSFYKKVQMVFQNPQESISHRLNVLEALIEPLKVQGIGRHEEHRVKAKKVLTEVELPSNDNFLYKYAHNLSGDWLPHNHFWTRIREGRVPETYYMNDLYLSKYPAIGWMMDDNGRNSIWRNVFYNCGSTYIRYGHKYEDNHPYMDAMANGVFKNTNPGFADAEAGDFSLSPDAPLFDTVCFKPIPADEIGLYDDIYSAT